MNETSTPPKIKWKKTKVGNNSVIYEKPLSRITIRKMPKEVDTYLDVSLLKLVRNRIAHNISKFNPF